MSAIKNAITRAQIAAYPDPSISRHIGPLSHAYPWQVYTKWLGLQLTAKLAASYPVAELQSELKEVLSNYMPKQQFGQYHAGGWTGVSLNAIDGDPLEDRDLLNAVFAKTPAIKFAPTMEAILDSFPCDVRRARLLKLESGQKIFWHSDLSHGVDSTVLRLHVPIFTNEKVGFQISHQDCAWQAGELWYGDFTFPHRLQNGGEEGRVHLVMDLVKNDELLALLPESLLAQRGLRTVARKRCISLMRWYNRVFATEKRLKHLRAVRGAGQDHRLH
jgi:hypothetical protein